MLLLMESKLHTKQGAKGWKITHLNISQNPALREDCWQWRGSSRGSSVPEIMSAVPGTNT